MSDEERDRGEPQSPDPDVPLDDSNRAGCEDHNDAPCDNSEELNPVPVNSQTLVSPSDATSQSKGKRKARDSETPAASPLTSNESAGDKSRSRTRLTRGQKIEVLQLLRENVQYKEIARRYTCSERTIYSIAEKRETLEKEAESAGYDDSAKSLRPAAIPKVQENTRCQKRFNEL